ncbi:hypothetical protein [Rhizobium rhizogenes]|uniref:hypothetical protein n=1 Tax=Rhizobium rhizogenes TaxID=359 RepID=UPI0004D72C63|nr:hypothetical protein [Rhizobium rhizogenes]KEA07472.1 hypothetical protein CN09_11210 [Rhizobium rhizogenes]NTJ22259.1 hypothetical protein [Rhizobium rhizogenes]QUE80976.1 hypothetical protein EML492_03970 [Rhizobium rhizogenes]TQO80919.1 hypothetical protein FFE80_07435 [Rhizobium rhizogenes]TRB51513.1 hypothetical protein EXN69_26320 [Rhizobium rhizogenes]
MIALLTSAAGRWLIGAVAAVLVLVGTYAYAHHGGYVQAETYYTAQIAQLKADIATARANEIERQAAVNDAAKASEARSIAQMQADNQTLQTKIEELQREASQDPDAGRAALGSSSVRRINQIR